MSETTKITFSQTGDFEAMHAAEQWCADNGYSVGSMQRDDPRGLLKGDCDISKWRNLSAVDRFELDGTMSPVVIELKATVLESTP